MVCTKIVELKLR